MSLPLFTDQASTFAKDVDTIFFALVALTVVFTTLVLGVMFFLAYKYRRGSKADRSNPIDENLPLELAWSLPPLIFGVIMFAWAAKPYTDVYRPPADAAEIFVIGKRWMWHMQHANGIREQNELHIPINKAVKVTMISQDVIHGFYVPAFRAKRDCLPGWYNTFWFMPTKTGKFHLFCTEYCGTNHSEMGGWVYVMTPSDYQHWEQSNGNTATAEVQTLPQKGENLFETLNCGNCHAEKDNVHGPSLYSLYMSNVKLDNGEVVTADENYLRESIINPGAKIVAGYENIMQGYEVGDGPGYLNEEQILALVSYIKTLGPTSGNMVLKPTPGATPVQTKGQIKTGRKPIASKSAAGKAAVARPHPSAKTVSMRTDLQAGATR